MPYFHVFSWKILPISSSCCKLPDLISLEFHRFLFTNHWSSMPQKPRSNMYNTGRSGNVRYVYRTRCTMHAWRRHYDVQNIGQLSHSMHDISSTMEPYVHATQKILCRTIGLWWQHIHLKAPAFLLTHVF